MDRRVLLLLCLQVFLLLISFTSTEPVEKRDEHSRGIIGNRRKRHCNWRPGGCSLAARGIVPAPHPTKPPPSPGPVVLLGAK